MKLYQVELFDGLLPDTEPRTPVDQGLTSGSQFVILGGPEGAKRPEGLLRTVFQNGK